MNDARKIRCAEASADIEGGEGVIDCRIEGCSVSVWRSLGSDALDGAVSLSPFASCRSRWGVPLLPVVYRAEIVPGSIDEETGTFLVRFLDE